MKELEGTPYSPRAGDRGVKCATAAGRISDKPLSGYDNDAVTPIQCYQISFNPNWICLDGVAVESISPAPGTGTPLWSNRALKSSGGKKLGRLNALKTSTRNCALKLSDILLIELFLNRDISKLTSPGPVNWLRLELPRRLLGLGNAKH